MMKICVACPECGSTEWACSENDGFVCYRCGRFIYTEEMTMMVEERTEMMQIEKARAFYLPDGSYIKAETFGGDVNAYDTDKRHWKSIDLHLVRPDGQDILFCGIEYEDGIGLMTLLFDAEHDEPIHEQVVLKAEELK